MRRNFSFNTDVYDFWEIYEVIKKYYPIGIRKSEGRRSFFNEYPGIKDLEKIVIKNVHNNKNYQERWGNFTKKLSEELKLRNVGTTYGQAPSFSSSIILEENEIKNCLHTKELHFSVSLIGPFFQIYGLDTTKIMEKDGRRSYGASNVVTTSPFEEFKEVFEFVEQKLEEKYPEYRLIPFAYGQSIIDGLSVRYLDDEVCTLNMAIFNQFLGLEETLRSKRGDEYYGIEKWKKKDH